VSLIVNTVALTSTVPITFHVESGGEAWDLGSTVCEAQPGSRLFLIDAKNDSQIDSRARSNHDVFPPHSTWKVAGKLSTID